MAYFYYCGKCGNVAYSYRKAALNCCADAWKALDASGEPNEKHQLDVRAENNRRIYTSHHVQSAEHYFPFIAFVPDDGPVEIKTFRPDDQVCFTLCQAKHGKLYWFCNLHGLYEMEV